MRPAVDLERFDPAAGAASAERGAASAPCGPSTPAPSAWRTASTPSSTRPRSWSARRAAPEIEATIAGDGAEAPELRARLANGGPRGVRMLGAVPSERIPALYAETDIAVVMLRDRPIFEGALPTKMLEAMAAGRPVVLSARGEAARLVEAEGAGVVVEPESPAALAGALPTLPRIPSARPPRRRGPPGGRADVRPRGLARPLGGSAEVSVGGVKTPARRSTNRLRARCIEFMSARS